MYWFNQQGKSALSPVQSVHLSLDVCEQREAPSSLLTYLEDLFNGPMPTPNTAPLVVSLPNDLPTTGISNVFVPFVIFNQAPSITNFQAVVGPNGQVTFSGTVVDDQDTTGDTVTIKGDGINLVTVVGENGHFSVSTVVNATGDVAVAATVADVFGNVSATAYTTFTPSPIGGGAGGGAVGNESEAGLGTGSVVVGTNEAPALSNVEWELDDGGVVIIRGTVTDDQSPTGYTVLIQGNGVETFTVVGEDGTFSVGFQRPTAAEFTVAVKVVDGDGASSNIEYVIVPGL